jgi:hypothetical protein
VSNIMICIVIAIALAAVVVVTVSAAIDLSRGRRFGETLVRWVRKALSALFTIP